MAWAEHLKTGWRGRYRDQYGIKRKVVQADGSLFPRKKDAKEAAEEEAAKARRQAAVDQGTLSAGITWGEWWDTIVDERHRQFDSDTPRNERSMVETHIRPKWGEVPMNKISQKRVQKWVEEGELKPRPGLSPGYCRRVYSVFSVSMTKAVKEEVLDASPCVGVELPKIPKRPKPRLTLDEKAKMDERGKLRADYQDVVDVLLDTGLRPAEICGLHANRVDLETGWIEVAEVLIRNKRMIRPCPKDEDVRQVPLTSRVVEIIRRHLAGRNLETGCGFEHTDGAECDSALVFLTQRGRPLGSDAIGQCMRRAAEKAKVQRRSMYAGRRGFATRAAEGGMDAFTLADLMGHADVRLTRGYVQTTAAARRSVIAALGETTPLTVVRDDAGQRGAPRGADLPRNTQDDTGPRRKKNSG